MWRMTSWDEKITIEEFVERFKKEVDSFVLEVVGWDTPRTYDEWVGMFAEYGLNGDFDEDC